VPPNTTPKCKFNGGCFWGNHFYTCTFNEVIRINLTDWVIDHYFTKKSFNDLHHVYVDEGGIYVCNAGLDVVEHFDHEGNPKSIFPLMNGKLWEKFGAEEDYRYVAKIEPRETHPNYLFRHNGMLLVNCPLRRVVANLADNQPVLEGFPGMMHDGVRRGRSYYWTTVDGTIIVADATTFTITEQINLKPVYGRDEPGWCRGLEVIGDQAFVGFTRFRKPSKKDFLKFAARGRRVLNSHVLCYDLSQGRAVSDWFLKSEDAVIYGIYACPAITVSRSVGKGLMGGVLRKVVRRLRGGRADQRLSATARAEVRADHLGLPARDPGVERAIDAGIGWLCQAQDHSRSHDGGVARHFSLTTGWSSSYPETTGYIVPTMLEYATLRRDASVRDRARRMLDWLVGIQLPDGGFQGGLVDSQPIVAVTFNTGQILLGLAAGASELGEAYLEAMTRAADWLVETQDADGCWRQHPTPFASPGEKVYDAHVAAGLFAAGRVAPGKPYRETALRNVRWALGFQRKNGWLEQCCLDDALQPLTHTIGYALRGLIDAYRATNDPALLKSARLTADGLLGALRPDGFLPGRLGPDWDGRTTWACLTGTAQIAACWLMLYQDTGQMRFREAGLQANRYLRRSLKLEGPSETRGGIKGSFPVDGNYGAYEYLNWACKFFIDANMLELRIALGGRVWRTNAGEPEAVH
jgi:hypothetical protein